MRHRRRAGAREGAGLRWTALETCRRPSPGPPTFFQAAASLRPSFPTTREAGETVTNVLRVPEFDDKHSVFFATRQGFISPESFNFIESAVILAIVVLGGMGSIVGAFWGGMTIGLVQQMSTLVLPIQLQNTMIFVVFVLVLLVKPEGLFGRSSDRA